MVEAILILASFFAGVAFTLLCVHAFGIRLLRVARALNVATQKRPAFEIPLELDKDRVVEVGYAQAVKEEAQRIGRLN